MRWLSDRQDQTIYINCNTLRLISSTALLPLSNEEPKPKVIRRESDLRPLGEVQHISLGGMHFLASLVRDIEAPVDNDLHLMVGVLVDKRRAWRKSHRNSSVQVS